MGAGKGKSKRVRSTAIPEVVLISSEVSNWCVEADRRNQETFETFYGGRPPNRALSSKSDALVGAIKQGKILDMFIRDLVVYGAIILPCSFEEWAKTYKVALDFSPGNIYMEVINKHTKKSVPVPNIFGSVFPVSPMDKILPALLPNLPINSENTAILSSKIVHAMNHLLQKERKTSSPTLRAVDVAQLPEIFF